MKEVSTRSLTIYYVVALLILGGLLLGCHAIMIRELNGAGHAAAIINQSGRQRMLTERIARSASEYRLQMPGARENLLAAASAMERSHRVLAAEAAGLNSSTGELKRLHEAYDPAGTDSLEGQIVPYLALARHLVSHPASDADSAGELTMLSAEAAMLVLSFEEVVTIRELIAEQRDERLKAIQTKLLWIAFLTMLAEALTIFRPMVRRTIRSSRRWQVLATTDALTGVANRRNLLETGLRELGRARRSQRPTSLLVLDIDHFKQINDRFGHAAGDAVLAALACALQEQLRPSDLLGRIGGEEFAVLLPETVLPKAALVAERLRAAAETVSTEFDGHVIRMTVSIGAALVAHEAADLSSALAAADRALYRAKHLGRNRTVCSVTPDDYARPDEAEKPLGACSAGAGKSGQRRVLIPFVTGSARAPAVPA